MHVLFVTEKYDNPRVLKLANSFNTLIGTYKDVYQNDPNYTFEHLTISEKNTMDGDIHSYEQLNQILLNKDFDIVIVSMHRDVVVNIETAKKLGKKLFLMYWDTHLSAISSSLVVNFRMYAKTLHNAHVNNKHTLFEYSEFCNCIVTDYGYGEEFENVYGVTTPQIDSIMKPLELEKIYDVSFIGSPYTHERQIFFNHLEKAGLKVHLFGGRGDNDEYLSVSDYAIKINQTKINLNLNHSDIQPHRKGRAYEIAACGGFMLATHPEVYRSKNGVQFRDGEDFISVRIDNVVKTIKHYLDQDNERLTISENLRNKYATLFTAKKWWSDIFNMEKN